MESGNVSPGKDFDYQSEGEIIDSAPEYSREELIYLAKLCERSERYEDAVGYICEFVKIKPILNSDERRCLSNCFKQHISNKRSSMRNFKEILRKESKPKGNKINLAYVSELIEKLEEEENEIIAVLQSLIDDFLLPNSKKPEAVVFYMCLKADFLRYKAEISRGEEYEVVTDLAEQIYNEAYMLSEEELAITSVVRLGVALNFSLFYYEHKGLIEEAIVIARNSFDEAIKAVDDLEPDKAKDYILLVQILKENSIFWQTEKNEEE